MICAKVAEHYQLLKYLLKVHFYHFHMDFGILIRIASIVHLDTKMPVVLPYNACTNPRIKMNPNENG